VYQIEKEEDVPHLLKPTAIERDAFSCHCLVEDRTIVKEIVHT